MNGPEWPDGGDFRGPQSYTFLARQSGMLTLRHRSTVGGAPENLALERDRTLIEAIKPVGRNGRSIVWLFAASLFLSSLLMFAIEPIVGRTVLPILGGTPMVWNTCVLFFQILLLAGYAYAHGVTRWLKPRYVGAAYGVVLLLPFLTLPFSLGAGARPPADGNPIGWLLLVLAQSIGLPFFALAATAPFLQRWFSDTDHPAAADPYFLYAASNLGSLLSLVLYPVLVEPMLRLRMQTQFWTIGYAGFVVAAGLAVAAGWRRRTPATRDPTESADAVTAPLTWPRRVAWIVLAFIPSSLMLGVTTYFSTDIAAVPLLWIAPLALYLLTFVVAFSIRSRPSTHSAKSAALPSIGERLMPLVILPIVVLMMGENRLPLGLVILLHLGAFTMAALLCHRRVAADRPETIHLTEFYFWIAFGGMLGGVFNTLAAPLLFSRIIEYPLVLVLALAARRGNPAHARTWSIKGVAIPLGIGALTAGLLVWLQHGPYGKLVFLAGLGPLWVAVYSQSRIPLRFAASIAAMLLAGSFVVHGDDLYVSRTFFGVYRVARHATGAYHAMVHGTTLHGLQAIDPARQGESLTYYHRQGPIGQAFEALPPSATDGPIAVVGLGVGSLAGYRKPGQQWTFYEIDPEVERIARTDKYFTYLRACGDDCHVVLGDARLSLERVAQRAYGLMILDAFSSDAIPVHLMTREAMGLYLSRLAPGGVLAFHISNRHLNLTPVLARIAISYGLEVRQQRHKGDPAAAPALLSSWWMVIARNAGDLGSITSDARWTIPDVPASTPLWTDDFSNIMSVLSLTD